MRRILELAAVPSSGLTCTLWLPFRAPQHVADRRAQAAERAQPAYVRAGGKRDFHRLKFGSGDRELGDMRSLLDRRRNRTLVNDPTLRPRRDARGREAGRS